MSKQWRHIVGWSLQGEIKKSEEDSEVWLHKKRRMEQAPSGVIATQGKNLPFFGGRFLCWSFFLSRCLFGSRFLCWSLFGSSFFLSRRFLGSRFLCWRFLLCSQCTHPLSK